LAVVLCLSDNPIIPATMIEETTDVTPADTASSANEKPAADRALARAL